MDQHTDHTQPNAAQGERFTEPRADRAPTAEEAAAAERAARHVDVDDVAEHAEEMNRIGADVKGEGDIDPTD